MGCSLVGWSARIVSTYFAAAFAHDGGFRMSRIGKHTVLFPFSVLSPLVLLAILIRGK
jgi:hypothetical protein